MGFYILEIHKNSKGDLYIDSRVKTSPRDQEHIIRLLNILKKETNEIVRRALISTERGNNGTGS